MAELSKIRKNGVDYDIKDETARAAIEELKKNTGGGEKETVFTKSGQIVKCNPASGSDLTVSATDATSVWRGGKNLIDVPEQTDSWATQYAAAIYGDRANGLIAQMKKLPKNTPLQISFDPYGDGWVASTTGQARIMFSDQTWTDYFGLTPIMLPEDKTVEMLYLYCKQDNTTGGIRNIQLEYGTVSSEYEEYRGEWFAVTDNKATIPAISGENVLYADSGNITVSGSETGEVVVEDDFDVTAYNLPILELSGDTTLMDKDNAVDMQYVYGDRTGTVSVKWQGSSSIAYPKKNYTLKFDNAFEAREGWGAQKKYCLKANWVDASHARNIVSAKLWGQVVRSRADVPGDLDALPNCGAIDGFPCIITINGRFWGLYTWNIPKDGWMLGMGSGENEAIFCAEGNGGPNGTGAGGPEAFKQTVSAVGTGFDLEYAPDKDNAQWAVNSLNSLITDCINATPTAPGTTLDSRLDWNSAIDYLIFVGLFQGEDNMVKNYLLYTKDGTKWGFTPYDMDGTWGARWNGKSWGKPAGYPVYANLCAAHKLYRIIREGKTADFKARYKELRASVLSEENVYLTFLEFLCAIPVAIYNAEHERWAGLPSTNINAFAQITAWYRMRVKALDAEVEAM